MTFCHEPNDTNRHHDVIVTVGIACTFLFIANKCDILRLPVRILMSNMINRMRSKLIFLLLGHTINKEYWDMQEMSTFAQIIKQCEQR